MTTKEKTKESKAVKVVFKEPLTQRDLETWSNAFNEEGGPDAKGILPLSGAYARALVKAGLLVTPKWETPEDVNNHEKPYEVIAVFRAFDEIYEELTTVPKN